MIVASFDPVGETVVAALVPARPRRRAPAGRRPLQRQAQLAPRVRAQPPARVRRLERRRPRRAHGRHRRDDRAGDRLLRAGQPRRLRVGRERAVGDRGERRPRLLRPDVPRVRLPQRLRHHGGKAQAQRQPGTRLRARAQGERGVGLHPPDPPAGGPVGDPRPGREGRLPRRPDRLPPVDQPDRRDEHPAQARPDARRVRAGASVARRPTGT